MVDAKKVKLVLKVDSQGAIDIEGAFQPIPGGPEFQLNKTGIHVSQDIYLGPNRTGNLTFTPVSPITAFQKMGSYVEGLSKGVQQKVRDSNTGKVY